MKYKLSIFTAGLILSGCATTNTPTKQTLNQDKFTPPTSITYPITDEEKRSIRVAKKMIINGKPYQLSYKTIFRTGSGMNGEVFGLLKDEYDMPIIKEDGSLYICNGQFGGSGPDHTEFIKVGNKLFMITQFECNIGAIYQAELKQDKNGDLTPVSLKFISQKDYHGGWVHCAGSKTPWNSFLGSEEYEPDASKLKADGTLDKYYNRIAPYFHGDLKKANPYFYGWITEIKIINENGDDIYTKHYSMGRFAHELAYVMPDKKTVYLSDDGTNCALFMYKADTPGDLSTGTLYAAKWIQTSDKGAGAAKLKWIKLGHATDEEIRKIVDSKPSFYDIFDKVEPVNGTCPVSLGYKAVNTDHGFECLRLKPGKEKEAAFLESRRYAALLGATTEFRKMEGITYNPQKHKLYIAISEISKGMEDFSKKGKPSLKYDSGTTNDIRLKYNRCGAVYQLDLDKDYTAKNMYGLIAGVPKKYTKNSPYYAKNNKCDINSISNPDNITYYNGILLIGEDTDNHQNDLVWAFDTNKNQLISRVASTPYGSETTSVMWQPNLMNGYTYINFVTQHPFGESDQDKLKYPSEVESYVGYIKVSK